MVKHSWIIASLAYSFIAYASITSAETISTGQKIYNDVSGSVYSISSYDEDNKKDYMFGSAVAISKSLLATNCHVALWGNFVFVGINNQPSLGRLFYYNKKKDICIVEISGTKLNPVNIRPSKTTAIGEEVYAVGNPDGKERTISKGIISNKVFENGELMYLQTDASISHGSSGGGLFDKDGNLIGITTSSDAEGNNINFAIPSELILDVIQTNNEKSSGNDISNVSTPTTDTSPNFNKNTPLVFIGNYGNNKIELMRLYDRCLILIPGRNSINQQKSLAIWTANNPDGILIFSRVVNPDDIVKFIYTMSQPNNGQFISSKSYIFIDKNLYPLSLVSIKKVTYPVYYFEIKTDLTETLVALDYFLGQFYDYNHDSSMTTIKFSLDGFTEALAAYNKNCSSGN